MRAKNKKEKLLQRYYLEGAIREFSAGACKSEIVDYTGGSYISSIIWKLRLSLVRGLQTEWWNRGYRRCERNEDESPIRAEIQRSIVIRLPLYCFFFAHYISRTDNLVRGLFFFLNTVVQLYFMCLRFDISHGQDQNVDYISVAKTIRFLIFLV